VVVHRLAQLEPRFRLKEFIPGARRRVQRKSSTLQSQPLSSHGR
jgi:hypothetical protein